MNFLKRFHWFEIALIIAFMSISLYAACSAPHNFSMRWYMRDDAYYYYKVAQNISEGHGSTFDGVNPTNGYHPLWLVICIPIFALARFDLILPLRILLVVMAAINVATSILLFRLLKKPLSEPVAMLAAAFWAFDLTVHSIVTQPGMETGIVALSVVLMLYLLQNFEQKWRSGPVTRGDILRLALAALFMLFSRLDTIYLVLIVGVWIIFRRTPMRYLLPADLLATFVVIVLAFIQRATLKIYLLVYADSAILMAAVTFVIQTIVFTFSGLYQNPKQQPVRVFLLQTLLGVSVSTLLSAAVMLILSAMGWADIPRTVPLLYWAGTLLTTILIRLDARLISSWHASPLSEPDSDLSTLPALWLTLKNSWQHLRENFKTWLHDGIWYYGIVGGALGAYMLINKLFFGTPMPVSGQIKRWWGSLPNDVYGGSTKSIADLFGLDMVASNPWGLLTDRLSEWANNLPLAFAGLDKLTTFWLALIGLAVLWLALSLKIPQKNLARVFQLGLIPLLISAELHTFLYSAMAYAAKHEWYWTMQMLALVILAAMGLSNLLELLPIRKLVNRLAWTGAGVLSLYLWVVFIGFVYARMPYKDPYEGQPYMDQLPILEGFTEPGSLIGMTGGGNAGYFIKDRTIVNMDGLINSYDYFQAVKNNQGGEFLDKMGLDYVFGNAYILQNTMPYRAQFKDHLLELLNVPLYGRKQLMKFVPSSAINP